MASAFVQPAGGSGAYADGRDTDRDTVREFVFDRMTHDQSRQLGMICQLILDGLPPDDSWPNIPAH